MERFLRQLYQASKTLGNTGTVDGTRFYEYEAIGANDIRIITLHPNERPEEVQISISCQAVDQIPSPTYRAVSYVWGKPRLSRSVRCNGATLEVTANVLELLQRLRLPDKPIRLWIDAICINQLDISERNHQVSLMKTIYSKAEQVLIWTGNQDSNTSSVFSLFESIVNKEEALLKGAVKDSFRDIAAFVNRPWFHRAWTFQELCLAKNAQVLCGESQLSWDTIAKAFKVLESHGLSQSIFGDIADCMTASSRFYANAPESQQPYLSIILPLTRKLAATDPRDKVFAMLSLVDTSCLQGVKPDYTLSVAEVYTTCTRAIIVQEQGLSVFSSVMGTLKNQDLPSWVPDWRLPRRTAYLHGYDWPATINFYELNRYTPIQYQLEPGAGGQLYLDGARLCTVTAIRNGDGLLKAILHGLRFASDPVGTWNRLFPHFSALSQSLGLPDTYTQTGESSKITLLRVLTANHLPEDKLMQNFVMGTINSCRPSHIVSQIDKNPRLKAYLDDPRFKKHQSTEAGYTAAEDVETFLFLCQMALDALDFKLPKPRGSFFGTVGQQIFGKGFGIDIVDYVASMMQTFLRNRVLFNTSNGLIGLGPDSMAVGDEAWDLIGGTVPFILRKPIDGAETTFRLVGECYVHGIMNGEIWSSSTTDKPSTLDGQKLAFKKIKLI